MVENPIVSPNSIFEVNVERMSLWHDRADMSTAGVGTVTQELVKARFTEALYMPKPQRPMRA